MWNGDTYRRPVVEYIKKHNLQIEGRDNYQYGIFTGTTLTFIYEMFRLHNLDVKRILAFDSFEGLPDEKPGLPRHPIWNKHEFNMKYTFKTDNTAKIVADIESKLPDKGIPIIWFEGYFSDVLNDKFIQSAEPKPAFWVDLDVDLYISAFQVLDFMLGKKLIVKDTVISYDDWGGTEEFKGGESLAHKEMCGKYGMVCEEIHNIRNGEHCQKAFIVKTVG